MSTIAVTQDAPAVSQDTSNSNFLPTGEKYRLTGEMPEPKAKAEVEVAPVTEGDPAAPDSETAAASEAAKLQEKGPAQTKNATGSESRWAKITRENRELREERDRLRAERQAAPQQRETKQEPLPAKAANAEPQIEDVDASGKPKYATLKDFMAAHAKWNREEAIREFTATSEKTQREQQQAQSEQVINQTITKRAEDMRKVHPDYDEAIATAGSEKDQFGQDAFYFTKGSHLDGFFLDSERGQEVMYEIAKNMDQYKHIFARNQQGQYLLNPVRQLRELAKIENSLPEKGKAAPVRQVTQAPRPPHQVSGKGTVGKDAVETALEENDSEAYMREANARALARLKKGK